MEAIAISYYVAKIDFGKKSRDYFPQSAEKLRKFKVIFTVSSQREDYSDSTFDGIDNLDRGE
jgi:hypothetical protein